MWVHGPITSWGARPASCSAAKSSEKNVPGQEDVLPAADELHRSAHRAAAGREVAGHPVGVLAGGGPEQCLRQPGDLGPGRACVDSPIGSSAKTAGSRRRARNIANGASRRSWAATSTSQEPAVSSARLPPR